MHQVNIINNLKILNSRETKHIVEILKEQYECELDLSEYVFLMNKDNKIHIASRNIELIPYQEMKIDSLGMYFGEMYKESLRLSIEGSQLVGPTTKNNIIELTREQMLNWVKGIDIPIYNENIEENKDNNSEDNNTNNKKSLDHSNHKHSKEKNHFIITKYNDGKTTEYFGAGRIKDGILLNMVSKSRRLVVVNE